MAPQSIFFSSPFMYCTPVQATPVTLDDGFRHLSKRRFLLHQSALLLLVNVSAIDSLDELARGVID